MEGSKMHSLELQFSLIQNEKERLFTCLNSTIQKAQSLRAVPSAASRILRDNGRLLLLLTEWADSAELRLPELYTGPAELPAAADGEPASSSRSAGAEPVPPSAAVHSRRSTPPHDMNTTLDSAASFYTAVGGGRAGRSTAASSLHGPDPPVGGGRVSGPPDAPSLHSSGPLPGSGRVSGPAGAPSLHSPDPLSGGGRVSGSAGAPPLHSPDPPSRPQRTPDQDSRKLVEDLSVLHASKNSVSKKSSGEVSSIISRHLQKKKSTPEPPKVITQKRLAAGVEHPVVFSCHDDVTGYTYLNLKEDERWLAELTQQLTSLALHPARVSRLPREGELVMAAWQGAWYRAKVTEVSDRGDASSVVTLQYIDYGNCDQQPVSEVRFLPDKMKVAPAAAFKCKLTNLKVGGADHWPLQRRLLHLLAEAPHAQLSAVLRASQLPELHEASLASRVTLAGETMKADVVATLNNVLTLDPGRAALQAESASLDLTPLLVPFHPPVAPVAVVSEQRPEEKVRSWLAGQTASSEASSPTSRGSRTTTRHSRQTGEINLSFASAESRPKVRRRRAPPAYSGLSVLWTARPTRQLPTGTDPYHVLMLHIHHPDLFYIGIRTQLFDAFEERLNAVYSGLPLHPEQAVRDLLLPGSYWVARWRPDDRQWYRCVVLEESHTDKGDEPRADYPVFWVDYGDTSRVAAASFRPMTEEFAAEPLFAVRARCAGVYPVDELGAPLSSYTADGALLFQDLLRDRACLALPVPSESTPECLAVLLEAAVGSEELLSVTDALCELGIAALRQPELHVALSPEPVSEQESTPVRSLSSVNGDAEWDPMAEDYLSAHNRADVAGSDAGGVAGRHDPDEQQVCPVYARGGNCWDGMACRKKHIRGGDQLPAAVPVYVSNQERLMLPRPGTTVYVKVSASRSPHHFYVQLPFGAIPAEEVNNNHSEYRRQLDKEETLESLSAAMQAAYHGSRRHDYSSTCRPALGEVLVAPWQGGWHRSLVTDLTDRLQPHQLKVEVFLVDHGVVIVCDATELREIKKQYNLLPYQAVRCTLAYVAPRAAAGWSPQAVRRFVQLVQDPCLLATVLTRLPDGQLELDLYGERCQLAQLLIQEGLAVPRRDPLPQPLPGQLLPG